MGIFTDYYLHDLIVVPERKGVPLVKWSKYYSGSALQASEAQAWDAMQGVNYGLLCGKCSGVIAIDIDNDELAEKIYKLAGYTEVRKQGSKGFTAFYRYDGEANKVWKDESGAVVVELLSSGRKTTIPPSQHAKTGKPYIWLERPLLDVPVNELPRLASSFISTMDSMFPAKAQQHIVSDKFTGGAGCGADYGTDYGTAYNDMRVELHEASEMLGYIDPDCNYFDWIKIGMGLCAEFGDAAFSIWEAWSKTGSKFDPKVNLWVKWKSFHAAEGVSIASVIYEAQRGGWYRVYNSAVEGDVGNEPWREIDISDYMIEKAAEIQTWNVEVLLQKVNSVEWVNQIPEGTLARLVRWITASALYPQPVLSAANAIAGLGALMGHRFQGETGVRTNMMIIGLAPSGSGKDHPIRCMQRLFYDCGLEKLIGGQPASGVGVIATVKKAGGRKLLQIDEIGRILAAINSDKAAGHEKQILTELMMIFSAAGGVYSGREYANQDDRPTVTIDQPCLSVYGATVAENLYDAISSRDAIDGFLSRWLLFRSSDGYVDRVDNRAELEVTEAMLELVQGLERTQVSDSPYALGIRPRRVMMSPEARELFFKYWDEIDKRKRLEASSFGIASLLARMPEHISKLALIAWHGDKVGAGDVIRAEHMQWAISVCEFCVANSVMVAREYITEGSFDKQTKRVQKHIIDAGAKGINRTWLSRNLRNLKSKELSECLTKLSESGLIKVERNNRKEVYFATEFAPECE